MRLPWVRATRHLAMRAWIPNPPLRTLAGLAAVVFCGFWIIWYAAPYDVAASIPHFPGVRWVLHSYMKHAVRTWSLGIPIPEDIDLNDPKLIALGAGHYETGCAPCHGAPGRGRSPIVYGERPSPPWLPTAVSKYSDVELYWFVAHGLKYTAMPHWPTMERPEEPWAVAAFVRKLPGMTPDEYEKLAYGPVAEKIPLEKSVAMSFGGLNARLPHIVDNCARCHGYDGMGRDGVAPRLAGQSAPFIESTLAAYAAEERYSGFMEPIAAGLSPKQRHDLAEYFSKLRPRGVGPGGDPKVAAVSVVAANPLLVKQGAVLALGVDTVNRLPSCASCHGPAAGPERNPNFPFIAGQNRNWLVQWLKLWRENTMNAAGVSYYEVGAHGGTPYANIMRKVASHLTDDEIEALASYYAAGAPTGIITNPPPPNAQHMLPGEHTQQVKVP